MQRPRFVVATVEGWMDSATSGHKKPQLSAHVCDTVYLHEVVATYRSEYRRGANRFASVVRDAEAHAERLNRDTA
jgi:hypothetical protein